MDVGAQILRFVFRLTSRLLGEPYFMNFGKEKKRKTPTLYPYVQTTYTETTFGLPPLGFHLRSLFSFIRGVNRCPGVVIFLRHQGLCFTIDYGRELSWGDDLSG